MNKKIYLFVVLSVVVYSCNLALATYGIQSKITNCTANQTLPDRACSPGAVLTIDTKVICVSGYTKTVRNVSDTTKKKVFAEYSISYSDHSNYEVDHIISLELGGSNDISNLYPESYVIDNNARVKDKFENYLHKQVCDGKLDIVEAQREISTDWFYYYQKEMLNITVATTTATTTANSTDTASLIFQKLRNIIQEYLTLKMKFF